MKKILFTVLSALALFSSCSSDNDTFTENVSDSNNEPKYTVNFDIKSDAFEVDKTPLRRATDQTLFEYVIYNEDGTVYSDSLYENAQVATLFNAEGTIPLSLELPEGNYHMAVLYLPNFSSASLGNYSYYLNPKNFDTDYYTYGDPSQIRFTVKDVYYEVVDIVVSANKNNDQKTIVLEPMWSEVELNLKDIKQAVKPSDTQMMRILLSPNNYGFSIKTKLASFEAPTGPTGDVPGFYAANPDMESTIQTYYPTRSADNQMSIKIVYGTYDLFQRFVELGTQEIKLNQELQNGRRYKISGIMPNFGAQESLFNITLNDLNSESIEVPFE